MFKMTVELLPGGDESAAEVIAEGRICNLRKHEPGSPLGSFHSYWNATAVPERTEPAYSPDELEPTYHAVGTCVIEDYPRREGSVWDLIATCLQEAGRGRPAQPTKGLTLASLKGGN